jgi:hypothetical protein
MCSHAVPIVYVAALSELHDHPDPSHTATQHPTVVRPTNLAMRPSQQGGLLEEALHRLQQAPPAPGTPAATALEDAAQRAAFSIVVFLDLHPKLASQRPDVGVETSVHIPDLLGAIGATANFLTQCFRGSGVCTPAAGTTTSSSSSSSSRAYPHNTAASVMDAWQQLTPVCALIMNSLCMTSRLPHPHTLSSFSQSSSGESSWLLVQQE